MCQNHPNVLAIGPTTFQPFLCSECVQVCVWHNEQASPERCKRNQTETDYSKYLGWTAPTHAFYCTAGKIESGLASMPSPAEISESRFMRTWL